MKKQVNYIWCYWMKEVFKKYVNYIWCNWLSLIFIIIILVINRDYYFSQEIVFSSNTHYMFDVVIKKEFLHNFGWYNLNNNIIIINSDQVNLKNAGTFEIAENSRNLTQEKLLKNKLITQKKLFKNKLIIQEKFWKNKLITQEKELENYKNKLITQATKLKEHEELYSLWSFQEKLWKEKLITQEKELENYKNNSKNIMLNSALNINIHLKVYNKWPTEINKLISGINLFDKQTDDLIKMIKNIESVLQKNILSENTVKIKTDLLKNLEILLKDLKTRSPFLIRILKTDNILWEKKKEYLEDFICDFVRSKTLYLNLVDFTKSKQDNVMLKNKFLAIKDFTTCFSHYSEYKNELTSLVFFMKSLDIVTKLDVLENIKKNNVEVNTDIWKLEEPKMYDDLYDLKFFWSVNHTDEVLKICKGYSIKLPPSKVQLTLTETLTNLKKNLTYSIEKLKKL